MARFDFDFVVIGSGAAGLAAARTVSLAGKSVCVLEARDRIGGRIHTLHDPALPFPLELGAEFIHGEAHETFEIVAAAGLLAVELPEEHWWQRDGVFQSTGDFWQRIAKLRTRIASLEHDVSFAEFLRRQRRLDPQLRAMATAYAEGYEAAHADRISALALEASNDEVGDAAARRQFRLPSGYDRVMEWLRSALDPSRDLLRLGAVVTTVRWQRSDVIVEAHAARGDAHWRVHARAAIITLPVGVLKAPPGEPASIRFEPEVESVRRALHAIEVGHVVKMMLRFRERFWDEPSFTKDRLQRSDAPSLAFLHIDDRYVPTWWTAAPMRAPLLTAWAGGHAADALLAEGRPEARIEQVLDSLSRALLVPRRSIDQQFISATMHDWQADPFSRGAYSYPGVGGSNAYKRLAKPIEATLAFAGEACNGSESGTVAGAIGSGRRAVQALMRQMS